VRKGFGRGCVPGKTVRGYTVPTYISHDSI
jgi:hypothetical protein